MDKHGGEDCLEDIDIVGGDNIKIGVHECCGCGEFLG
jgi:hypothetical protein